jgi:hypothetical protein
MVKITKVKFDEKLTHPELEYNIKPIKIIKKKEPHSKKNTLLSSQLALLLADFNLKSCLDPDNTICLIYMIKFLFKRYKPVLLISQTINHRLLEFVNSNVYKKYDFNCNINIIESYIKTPDGKDLLKKYNNLVLHKFDLL